MMETPAGTVVAEAAAEAQPSRPQERQVAAYDFRSAGQFSGKQFQSLNVVHEMFARNLSTSLGTALRSSLQITLSSIEPLSYKAYVEPLPEIAYVAAIRLHPAEALAILEIEPAIVFPVIDLLLGGQGTPEPEPRAVTEIEEHLLESLVQLICRELETVWQPLIQTGLRFEGRLDQPQLDLLMPAEERLIVLCFEIRVGESCGALKLALPVMVSNSLLWALSQQARRNRPAMPNKVANLRKKLQECNFPVELVLPDLQVSMRELLALETGRVLHFQRSVRDPALVLVCGRGMFTAYPAASTTRRAAQIQQRLPTDSTSERNWKHGE